MYVYVYVRVYVYVYEYVGVYVYVNMNVYVYANVLTMILIRSPKNRDSLNLHRSGAAAAWQVPPHAEGLHWKKRCYLLGKSTRREIA